MNFSVDRSDLAFVLGLIENHISELNEYIRYAPRGEDTSLERQNISLLTNLLERLDAPDATLSIGEVKSILLLAEAFRDDAASVTSDPFASPDLHNEAVGYFKQANRFIKKLKAFIRELELSEPSSHSDS